MLPFFRKFGWWLRRRDREAQLRRELQFHLEEEADGAQTDEARWAARRELGNLTLVQENTRAAWGWTLVEQLGQDLRYGLRALRKAPSFTVAAALTIALGVGANTAVFSLINAVLLQSLAVRNPGELVFVEASGAPPYPLVVRLRDQTHAIAEVAAFTNHDEVRIEMEGRPEQAVGQVVSANYFEMLGVRPAVGRLLESADGRLDPPVAVISEPYWRRRFGGSPDAIGRKFVAGRRSFTIVGVAPREFPGLMPGSRADLTLPIGDDERLLTDPNARVVHSIARLSPGVTAARALAEGEATFRAFAAEQRYPAQRLELLPASRGEDALRQRFSKPLAALMGIVALLLMMAVANIANLLLARGIARRREFAVRLAMGGGRSRLIRQLITETLLLFACGAIPGVVGARWVVRTIEGLFAQGRRAITLEAPVDWRVLGFSLAVTLAAGLVAGLFPAWRAFRGDPEQALREGNVRSGDSRGSTMLTRSLVAVQVALSVILLVGAVTFVKTLWNLRNVDTGVRNDRALTMSIELAEAPKLPEESGQFWGRMLAAIREIPGVRGASMSVLTPLSGRDRGAPLRVQGETVRVNQVSDGYFETLGIPLLRGRLLADRDAAGTPKIAVINEAAARKFFAGRDPIGEAVEFAGEGRVYRVVGIVRDTKHRSLREPAVPFVFVPMRQPLEPDRRVTLSVVAERGDETALLPAIRSLVARTDSRMLVSEVITLRGQIESTLLTERLLSGLAAAFGGLAMILAAVGLYGVLSHHIGRQRQAIGIKMALGATASSIRFQVMRDSAGMVAAGLACGLPLAVFAARAADSLFWDVTSGDAGTYAVAVGILALAGLASAYVPAQKASSIEPAEALRHS